MDIIRKNHIKRGNSDIERQIPHCERHGGPGTHRKGLGKTGMLNTKSCLLKRKDV